MTTTPPASSGSDLHNLHESAAESVPASEDQRILAALLELEQHVHRDGWDGAPRLFALGRQGELLATEPELANALGLADQANQPDDARLVPIEQEWGTFDGPLDETLAQIMWPPQVVGAALTMERVMLPPEAEEEVAAETDPLAQMELAMNHPKRQDMRVAVAVLRDGPHMCAVRVRSEGEPADAQVEAVTDLPPDASLLDQVIGDQQVLTGADLAPGLVEALRTTFEDDLGG